MAVGVPTISSPLSSNLDIDGGCGNLFATSVDEWTDAILDVYRNQSKYDVVGTENRKYALRYYLKQQNYKQYIEVYSKLCVR